MRQDGSLLWSRTGQRIPNSSVTIIELVQVVRQTFHLKRQVNSVIEEGKVQNGVET